MVESAIWERLKEVLGGYNHFILTTHVNPDGDGLGSEVALASLLARLGKVGVMLNPGPTPENYKFIDLKEEIVVLGEERGRLALQQSQVVILLDCGDFRRLGDLAPLIESAPALKICVDHHLTPGPGFDLAVVDRQAPATGMMIYKLIHELVGPPTSYEARALYAALLRETGCFRFENTTPEVHRAAAELLELGARVRETYEEIYERSSLGRLKLLGHLLSNLEVDCDGRLVWMAATRELLDRFGVDSDDLDGFVDYPRALRSAEVVVLFTEREGKVKVSLRSKGGVDVNRVAEAFGGGGHRNASGATLNGSLEGIMGQVLGAVKKEMGAP